jgi:hypothetical protein
MKTFCAVRLVALARFGSGRVCGMGESLGQVLWECCDHELGVRDVIGWLWMLYLSGLWALVCLFVLFRCCCLGLIVNKTVQRRIRLKRLMMMMTDGKQLDVGGGASFSEENTDYPT